MFDRETIFSQLRDMDAPQDGVVLMHSSLRAVGETEGGGEGLLDALIAYFTAKGGLLCVPTHTAGNMFSGREITLDMASPDCDLGALSRLALLRGDGVRSENPLLSMVVFGNRAKAEAFVRDDAFIRTPTAPESCYGKLASMHGYVLLVGVGQEKSTYLHAVAEILGLKDRMAKYEIVTRVKRLSGEVTERRIRMFRCGKTPDISRRFPKYETAFRYHGCIRDGWIGNAPAQLCDAAKQKDVVQLIFSRAEGQDPLATEIAIPPAWFCDRK